ncbi:mannitol-1-phosphate 5-dehydrogenase [Jeotgalibacillus proteolyticus]|uniref:Mannitol-1-phosphate 5-dehydrogenase n=1 Tax=Jeotgalibacillus proteolyticus TaxID=2082395 RepID=A0A2S5GCG0_9BACL|nr:mannitol-1-phosphate 5-dehydrogenase [Jeotgalibacillus proteolyticus]PPA70583.1 mannitol-1-phosphate 5-dehydrogenase [Jeotgalibacillus proteolyticus]
MKKAVHFGAGNIGRGFIGAVLSKAGFEVRFVDVNDKVIQALNDKQEYTVQIASEEKTSFTVKGVSGINSAQEPDKTAQAIKEADLLTASVGPGVLPFIAKDIASGLTKAYEAQGSLKQMNIVACENMINGTDFLRAEIEKHLDEDVKREAAQKIGFPNSAVDRIVPIQQHEDPLTVQVEPFFEWVVERNDWKGAIPEMEGVQFVEDLAPFIERKLLTVNTGHAAIAYLGLEQGFETVDQAIADSSVKQQVEEVLSETSEFLTKKYSLSPEEHERYVEKILGRFENPYLSDDLARVGRAPLRKLGPKERLVYPAVSLMKDGVEPKGLIKTIAAALYFNEEADPESQSLQNDIKTLGAEAAFAKAADLSNDDPLVQAVIQEYNS